MEKLLRERKSLDARLDRAVRNGKALQSSDDIDDVDIQSELDNLLEIWAAYMHLHKRMMDKCTDEEMGEVLSHQSTFEVSFVNMKTTLLRLRKRFDVTSARQEAVSAPDGDNTIQRLAEQQAEFIRLMSMTLNVSAGSSRTSPIGTENASPPTDVKLPRMILPVFNGNVLEWPSFIDLFDSAVHKNTALEDSQKLYFLKTNLEGEAAALISHLRIEDINYAPALAKLKARYNKPLEIATDLIHRFLNQPSMTSPSASGLRSLHDVSDEVIRALSVMNQEGRDIWLLNILADKLDPETKLLWFQKKSELCDKDITLQKFMEFLDAQSCALKSVIPCHSEKPFSRRPTTLVATNSQRPSMSCSYCHKSLHKLYQCSKFRHLTVDERLLFTRRQNLCPNCLKFHLSQPCQSTNCRKCGLPHHTLLHRVVQSPSSSTPIAKDSFGSTTVSQTRISPHKLTTEFRDTNVLVLTAVVNVFDKFGQPHKCRALLDSASHSSYITADLCRRLSLNTTEVDFEFGGITGSTGRANRGTYVTFASRSSDYRDTIPCIVLDRLTADLPLNAIDISDWPIPESIQLADPQFYNPGAIDLLLGNKLFFQLFEPGTIKLGPDNCLPVLQNTKLGWMLSGGYKICNNQPIEKKPSCLLTTFSNNSSVTATKTDSHGVEMKQTTHGRPQGQRGPITVGGEKREIPSGNLVGGLCWSDVYGRSTIGLDVNNYYNTHSAPSLWY